MSKFIVDSNLVICCLIVSMASVRPEELTMLCLDWSMTFLGHVTIGAPWWLVSWTYGRLLIVYTTPSC